MTHQRPTLDDYFMEIALVVAKRSTCLRRQVGGGHHKRQADRVHRLQRSPGWTRPLRRDRMCAGERTVRAALGNLPRGSRRAKRHQFRCTVWHTHRGGYHLYHALSVFVVRQEHRQRRHNGGCLRRRLSRPIGKGNPVDHHSTPVRPRRGVAGQGKTSPTACDAAGEADSLLLSESRLGLSR